MNYATIKYCDIANGEGVRTSLFVSGCPHHCTGCFNEIAWDYNYGDTYDDDNGYDQKYNRRSGCKYAENTSGFCGHTKNCSIL